VICLCGAACIEPHPETRGSPAADGADGEAAPEIVGGGEPEDGAGSDGAAAPSADVATEPDATATARVGEACLRAEDCPGGWCLETEDASVCTLPCEAGCPDGWSCVDVKGLGEGLLSVCAPDPPVACEGGEPGPEICNAADDDCDGETDEGLGPGCDCGDGACDEGTETIESCPCDCHTCGDGICSPCGESPSSCLEDCCTREEEVCDGEDNDCDGVTDDVLGAGEPCEDHGAGPCFDGALACAPGGPGMECVALPRDCDDALPCTADSCDGSTGECFNDVVEGCRIDAACVEEGAESAEDSCLRCLPEASRHAWSAAPEPCEGGSP